MYWERVKASMLDELEKIGEVNLSGLSPRSVIELGQPAPPMPNAGLEKAMRVLDRLDMERASMPKVAAPRVPYNPDLPGINTLSGAKKARRKNSDKTPVEQGKSLGAHTLGGMASGRMLGFAIQPTLEEARKAAIHKRNWRLMMAGGALGASEFARRRYMEHRARKKAELSKKAAILSPGFQLKGTQQVGRAMSKIPQMPGPASLSNIAKGSLP